VQFWCQERFFWKSPSWIDMEWGTDSQEWSSWMFHIYFQLHWVFNFIQIYFNPLLHGFANLATSVVSGFSCAKWNACDKWIPWNGLSRYKSIVLQRFRGIPLVKPLQGFASIRRYHPLPLPSNGNHKSFTIYNLMGVKQCHCYHQLGMVFTYHLQRSWWLGNGLWHCFTMFYQHSL
jgi:hypothetical protein